MRRLSPFALLALSIVVPAATARAQLAHGGMDLHLFRPAVDSKGFLALDGTDILGANDISFGLVLDAGLGVLPFDGFVNDTRVAAQERQTTARIADALFTGTLHFNYGIANLLVVGAELPVQIVSGPNVTIPGVYNDSAAPSGLDHQSIGDVTFHAKARLLRAERDPIGIAAIVHLELPTGDASAFAGEPGVALWPALAAEWRPVRDLRLAINVGARVPFGEGATFPVGGRTIPMDPTGNATRAILDPTQPGTDLHYGSLLTFGAGASYRIAPAVDVVAEANGTQLLGELGADHALSIEAMGGLKVFVQRDSYLVLGAGAGLAGGFQESDVRGMLGFVFEPSIGDADGDGYKDDIDECPEEPEDFDNFSDEDGCPDPDNDRDGLLDVDDDCVNVPEDRDGDADGDGCPEGDRGDRDGDGILDAADACPDEPEDRDGFQDENGCPDPDNDGDGLLDADDLCPNDPEDRDGFQDEDGCPDPDNDQDRILDVNDGCKNDPEDYDGVEDEDGCPEVAGIEFEDREPVVLRDINFATDSAEILPRSFHLLDMIAASLNANRDIELIEIQGHADERSSDEYNIRLTRDRAAAVLEALVQRGVMRPRLRSGGYGERCPIDPRHNDAAWTRNRRVEFKVIRTAQGPTRAEVTCPAARELVPR